MIDYLTGITRKVHTNTISFEIGPIGLELQVPDVSEFTQGSQEKVYLYMHWNQENGPTFYGFAKELDRQIFSLIIGCSGIGPKIGLSILHDLGTQGFLEAIQTQDDRMLSKVNGIGQKKAEHIIVQLKHKVTKLLDSGIDIGDAKKVADWHTVSQALTSLNYSRTEVLKAMSYLKTVSKTDNSFDYLLRQALSFLSKQQ